MTALRKSAMIELEKIPEDMIAQFERKKPHDHVRK